MELKKIEKKADRLHDLIYELHQIGILFDELDFVSKDIDQDERDHFFGFVWHDKWGHPTEFALNGITKYANLTKNIIALAKVELDRRKMEIMDEIERDFGGIE